MASGISGSGAVISRSTKPAPIRQRSRRERNDDRGIQAIAHATEIERQHESDARRHDQAGAQHVEADAGARDDWAGVAAAGW